MDKLGQAYEVLGVPPEIPTHDLRRHYRELVKRWHPDQFAGNHEEQRVADETLRSINDAYQLIIRQRIQAGESVESEEVETGAPAGDSKATKSVAEDTEDEPVPMGRVSAATVWLFRLVVFLLLAGVFCWAFFRPSKQVPPSRAVAKPTEPAQAPAPPKREIAAFVVIVVDEVMPAVWHNGQRVPESKCQLIGDVFGATLERINITVKEDDWLVFNVASNPVRWGGATFLGVAGMITEKASSFGSSLRDGRWSYEERTDQLRAFIEQRDTPGWPVMPPPVEWDQGRSRMGDLTTQSWLGDPIWGGSHNTWIKFVARPLTNAPAVTSAGN